jgi:outer membrane receptor protein involved in Fe transport
MRFGKTACLLVALLLSALSVYAQETTGTLRGRIVDSQGLGVPGVTVTVTGPQGIKSSVTDTDGRFNVPFLTPGAYAVRAELQGFKSVEKKDINVSLGQTVDLPLKMDVGGITETVQVTGTATTIDTASTTTGAVIDSEMLQRIPVGRRVSDTLYLAPGVSSSGSAGSANPSISGGSGLDNSYVVDGVNVTNQGYGALGAYSIVFGSLGNATPFDFVKEVQVKTGGYEAEFGQSTGGVVNVVTKSGTNNLRGSVFGYTRPSGTESEWTHFQSTNGTIQTQATHLNDFGAEGGGPIVKNRAFFFGAIDPQWEVRTFHAPDPITNFPLGSLGDVDRTRRNVSYSAKGTFQLSNAHRIDASFFGDPSHAPNGPQRGNSLTAQTTSRFSALDYGGHNQTVRYDGVPSSRWLIEAYYARALNNIQEFPSVNEWAITDTATNFPTGPNVISGGIGLYESNKSLNNQYAIKSTNIIGPHQVKYGFEYDDVFYSQGSQRTGPTFTAPNGRVTATGASVSILPDVTFGKIYRVTRANFNSGKDTDQRYQNFFAQDSWKATDRFTVNAGIRYEQESLDGQLIKGWKLKNNWGPRLGATYDVLGDGKTKVFGNFGRFYARIPNDLAARSLSADDGISRADYFDAGLTRPIPNGTVTRQTASAAPATNHYIPAGQFPDVIDPNAKLSYLNEWVAGFEREIIANTTFGIRYIHRNIGRVLEDVANCPVIAYTSDPDACASVEYILTNPTAATPLNPDLAAATHAFDSVHFDDPSHVYNAVEFTLNRRLANNWSMLASYRWSRLRGNFEGFYRDDNGQSDPGITSLYDFPTNDPTYTSLGGPLLGYQGDIRFLGQSGVLPLDRPHQFKLNGNYFFPIGLSLGLSYTATTGKPLTGLAALEPYDNGGEIPTTARGAGIQTIDGFKTRTPFTNDVNAQAAYVFKMGTRSFTVMADVFNVFNTNTVLDYNTWVEFPGFGVADPDVGKPISHNVGGPQFQSPRQIRFGARFEF